MKKRITSILIFILCLSVQVAFTQHLTNNGTSIVLTEGTSLIVTGNITFLADASVNNSGDIFVGGNWINNSPDELYMNENSGTVILNGSVPQTIGGTMETHFSKLQLKQHTSLGTESSVSDLLGLINARLTLNDHHFIVRPAAQITGSGADAYIIAEGDGLLVREVGAFDVEFPIGTNSAYLPATLKNNGTPDIYGINVFEDVLDGGTTGSTIPEIDHCVVNTWNILELVIGGSDLDLTLQWNMSDEGPDFNRNLSGIGHYTNDSWNPQDASSASGDDPYSLTRTGITSIGSFAVGDNNSPMVVTIVFDEQEIFLSEGWTGISSYLQPSDPAIEEILAPVIDELVILQNFLGYYWPGQGTNTLGNWDTHSGYQIKMSGEIKLTVSGTPELNTTLMLNEGWNLIPVLANCGTDIENMFEGTSLVMIKGIASNLLYWPEFGIASLNQLQPGGAYLVLMGADEEVVFPDCDKSSQLASGETHNPSNMELQKAMQITGNLNLVPTPNTHSLAIPVSAFAGLDIRTGDVIEAFDENGQCYGMAQWKGEVMAMTLFGDDQTSVKIDGFTEMSPVSFKLFKASSAEEYSLEAVWDRNLPQHQGLFEVNGLSAITGFKVGSSGLNGIGENLIGIYPNPSTRIFNITGLAPKATIHIMDMHGLVLEEIEPMFAQQINIDLGDKQTGIYMMMITQNNRTTYHKLVLR